MLRWLKTVVVSDEEKARMIASGGDREGERKRTAADVSRPERRHRNRGIPLAPGGAWREPVYWPGGARHEGGASPVCGFCTERGKAGADTAACVSGWREGARCTAETGGAEYCRGTRWRTGS